MPLKLSANLGFLFQDKPLLERFEAAAKCGFKAVECTNDIYEVDKDVLVQAKEKANVKVILINMPKKVTALPGKESEFKESLDLAIDYATALDCPRIHLSPGSLSTPMDWSNPEWQAARSTYLSNVSYAADLCSPKGIILTLEPLSTIPNVFLQYQQQAADYIRELKKDNVKLQFDFYHAQRNGGNLCEFLEKNIDIVGHVQISQVPGRHEPDLEGEINCPFVFKTLERLRFDGWMGAEYTPRSTIEEGLDWAKEYINNS
ncbi:PREDICTED: putative hydroxypyruvate isomerase [Amphimedon queenslandica]|uniref:Putative hydroxypyruvate isomerase n=1 Tax=Amphimedon queenslandica TaxID=400682 RepID=A0A1X7VNI1_AMPQE|nr:PREDICTED: putative hydroxypyruvate isomerase [Amphimedon queenslandica]|eukprot:XP_003383330.1 PREDICTED: putative hydroxypyruvate isomerase [Amphimedon queenslandica]